MNLPEIADTPIIYICFYIYSLHTYTHMKIIRYYFIIFLIARLPPPYIYNVFFAVFPAGKHHDGWIIIALIK